MVRETSLVFAFLILVVPFVAQAETTAQESTLSATQSNDEVIQLRNAAELGEANAMLELGDAYFYGDGVTEDVNAAVEWYCEAAKAGQADAMNKLGTLYELGWGVAEDANEAAKWYGKAIALYAKDAETGDSDAMFELGKMYDLGMGVAEDANTALEWYRKASWAGNSDAMYELGDIYYYGENIEQDYTKALECFQKAAEAGNSDAMYKIGLMYENGKGIDKDYEQAKGWYKKAIELGDNDAKMRIAIIFLKKYCKVALWGFLAVLVGGGFIYGHERRLLTEDTKEFGIPSEPKDWTLGKIVRRYVGSLFVYLIYWLTLWGAMTKVIGASLSPDKARELVESGVIESIWEYGWGNHYIWFLTSFCFVTFCCASLVGATAKKKGPFVASIANLPIIIFMLLICWLFYGNAVEINVESPIAWKIILPLSVAGSICFSILGGNAGKIVQESDFKEKDVLGIRPFHWSWLWFVSYIYLVGIFYALVPIIKWSWADGYGPGIFQILSLLIYGYPMFLMYQILSGEILAHKNVFIKIISFIGIYLGGLIAALLFDLVRLGLFKLISYIF